VLDLHEQRGRDIRIGEIPHSGSNRSFTRIRIQYQASSSKLPFASFLT